jgi:hypothetical protein
MTTQARQELLSNPRQPVLNRGRAHTETAVTREIDSFDTRQLA